MSAGSAGVVAGARLARDLRVLGSRERDRDGTLGTLEQARALDREAFDNSLERSLGRGGN